ncbi:hypothetical protein F4818DRAFT_444668 [Hypoxylon cercidicola]|nr:hypothetical protein F4818DRAFT_444668 [Hypoxylon cercidicola]
MASNSELPTDTPGIYDVKDFALSGMHTIWIYPQKQCFAVYKDAFMACSPFFRDQMVEDPSKGRHRHTSLDLTDVDAYTFTGLVQFVYSGSYTVPTIDKVMPPLAFGYRSLNVMEAFFRDPRPSLADNRGVVPGKELFAFAFMDRYTDSERKTAYKRPAMQNPDMTDTFFRHADMYLYGVRFDIAKLRKHAMYQLADGLAHFLDTWDGMVCVASVICHLYEKTKAGDPIRQMLSMYTACRYSIHRWHPHIVKAFRRFPDFPDDTMKQVQALRDYKRDVPSAAEPGVKK